MDLLTLFGVLLGGAAVIVGFTLDEWKKRDEYRIVRRLVVHGESCHQRESGAFDIFVASRAPLVCLRPREWGFSKEVQARVIAHRP